MQLNICVTFKDVLKIWSAQDSNVYALKKKVMKFQEFLFQETNMFLRKVLKSSSLNASQKKLQYEFQKKTDKIFVLVSIVQGKENRQKQKKILKKKYFQRNRFSIPTELHIYL